MFKTLSGLTDDAFWRVSADTKTCGSPLYLPLRGGLCLPSGKYAGILTYFQKKSTKKPKMYFFWPSRMAVPSLLKKILSRSKMGFS
jgi:hypothetical protein